MQIFGHTLASSRVDRSLILFFARCNTWRQDRTPRCKGLGVLVNETVFPESILEEIGGVDFDSSECRPFF